MKRQSGFTIIELLVVVVVIAILAGITILSFGNWRTKTAQTEVKHELLTGVNAISAYRTFNNSNPATLSVTSYRSNTGVTMTYILRANGTYCLNGRSVSVNAVQWYVETVNELPTAGTCS